MQCDTQKILNESPRMKLIEGNTGGEKTISNQWDTEKQQGSQKMETNRAENNGLGKRGLKKTKKE